ncbi:hypothetical protein CRE_04448 [Caenorhabditis remanei]|uniref:Fido domain-containing protein n=1 Tax=Caenorhabditis remanei TaxID=31234 RepID=E3NSC8_CAERE|nr:hypothetical protein CRE_04448 [Caenorhabditis remanei]
MIVNNYVAMRAVAMRAADPLSPQMVLTLHAALTEGTLDDPADAGRLQRIDDHRVSVTTHDGMVVHTPPPAAELERRMEELCRFANATNTGAPAGNAHPYIPPIVRSIITHFMIGYDHPFADGNGRTARAVFYWSMLHHGYGLAEFLSISKILREAPGKYGDSYQHTEDDEGDLTYFILHQLRTILRALDDLDAYISRRRAETAALRAGLERAAEQFNARQTQLLEWIDREDVLELSARLVANRYRVTTQTARNDLGLLESLGLLRRGTTRRPITWTVASDYSARLTVLARPATEKGREQG